jgi:hypothetical protein
MTVVGSEQAVPSRPVRPVVVFLFKAFVVSLAIVGAVLSIVEVMDWNRGTRWTPADIEILLSYKGPVLDLLKSAWSQIKFVIEYGAYLIGAIALATAVARLRTVANVVSGFQSARAPIYTLATSVTEVAKVGTALTKEAQRLGTLEPALLAATEKMEDMLKRFSDMERARISDRETAEPDDHRMQAPMGRRQPQWKSTRKKIGNGSEISGMRTVIDWKP